MSGNKFWSETNDVWTDGGGRSPERLRRGRSIPHLQALAQAEDASSGVARGSGADGTESIDYAAFLRKIWRRKFLVALITIAGFAASAVYIMRLPPQYVAHAYIALG